MISPIDYYPNSIKSRVTIAEIDGKLIPYDACSDHRHVELYSELTYIGKGRIYSVDGIRQSGFENYHFWVKPMSDNAIDGEAIEYQPMPYEQAAVVEVEQVIKDEIKILHMDKLTQPQLRYIVEHSTDTNKVEAALTVLEHDFNMARPGAD